MQSRQQGAAPLRGTVLRAATLCLIASVPAVLAFEAGQATAAKRGNRRVTPVVQAVEHAAPAVVSIYADSRSRRGYIRRGAGSGVIVHPDGYVVTNSHVIRGGASIKVELFRESGTYPCSVVLDSPAGDLAVLKIRGIKRKLPYVSICPTRNLMLGETAIAIGNPKSLGDTITVGVVSALGRDAKMTTGVVLRDLVQTDAPINTGNSGGALLNLDGELIGIIVSLMPRASCIAFAVPGDQVSNLVRRALRVTPPANPLPEGAEAEATPPPAVSKAPPRVVKTMPLRPGDFGFDIQDNGAQLRIRRVTGGTAASRAGLLGGDVLLTVDGLPVEDLSDLLMSFSKARPGQEYYVGVRRGTVLRHVILIAPK